jgi:hypothetical protein
MEKPRARPRSSYSVSRRSNTYGSQVTPDSPRTNLKSGYFSQAPEAISDTNTSIVSSWKSADRTRRHWSVYSFSISGVSGVRSPLNPVEWNEIGKRHSAAASHRGYQS